MPPLVTRILLTILMFPFAALVYLSAFTMLELQSPGMPPGMPLIVSGVVAWAFIIIYWCVLWQRAVQPSSPTRIMQASVAMLIALAGGLGIAWLLNSVTYRSDLSVVVGSASAPLIWLAATILFWRESAAERELRLRATNATILCPVCAYNLTGLNTTRCPECGRPFTIDELLAKQSNRARELEAVG
jgi:hypothetical protein